MEFTFPIEIGGDSSEDDSSADECIGDVTNYSVDDKEARK